MYFHKTLMMSFTCHSFILAKLVKKLKPNYPEECLNMLTVHRVPELIQLKDVPLIMSTIGQGILTMKMI